MTTEPIVEQCPAGGSAGVVTDEQLVAMLVDRARGDGLKLTGEGGLLQQLTNIRKYVSGNLAILIGSAVSKRA